MKTKRSLFVTGANKTVVHSHPTLGVYTEYTFGSKKKWSAKTCSQLLDYKYTILGFDRSPSDLQLQRLRELDRNLPRILAEIEPPSYDDGYGNYLPTEDLSKVRPSVVEIRRDLSFLILAFVADECKYELAPSLVVGEDLMVKEIEWVP